MQDRHVGEHAPSAPDRSRAVCVWPPERMQRALLSPPGWSLGLLREVHQARLLQQVRKEREQGRIGTEDFTDQHEAQ
jgi:hypothetical protein